MKIKRKNLLFAGAALAVVLGVSSTLAFTGNRIAVMAENAVVETTEINDYYFVGDALTLPAEVAVVPDGGESLTGFFEALIMPDGKVLSETETLLDTAGEYKAVYVYTLGGKKFRARKTFRATARKWSVGSEDSSVVFSTGMKNEYGDASSTRYGGTGLDITLAAGDTFTFGEPVDLSKSGEYDIITMYSSALQQKSNWAYNKNNNGSRPVGFEAGIVDVTLTDCYNPDVFVTFEMFIHTDEGVYVRTVATNQGTYGLDPKYNNNIITGKVYIDGTEYGVYQNTYGGSLTSSGTKSIDNFGWWTFDTDTGGVYFNYPGGKFLANQVYNPDICGKVFPGFTTGEVYVSVSTASNYTSSTHLYIESIGGYVGEGLVDGKYEDNVAPNIVVNGGKELGECYVKTGEEFRLFDAVAYDPHLVGEVKAKVYYNYGGTAESSVLVKNNRFTPVSAGRYVIEYTAADSFGNVGRKLVGVNAVDETPATFRTETLDTMQAGVRVVLPAYKAESLNGEVTVSAAAKCGDKTFIADNDMSFIPTAVGEYEIVYTYADKLKTYEWSYTVTCVANETESFVDRPVFFDYYIKGLAYTLPSAGVYVFRGKDPTAVDYKVCVSFDGGEFTEVADPDEFTVTGSSTMEFRYVAGETEYRSGLLKIVDVGYTGTLDKAAYFVGDYSAEKSAYIEFTSDKTSGDNALEFISPLAFATFSLNWAMPADKSNYTTLSIVLTDIDTKERIVIGFYKENGKSYASYNGDKINLSEDIKDGKQRLLAYDADSGNLLYEDSERKIYLPLASSVDYARIKLEIVLQGLKGEAAFRIHSVQDQIMNRAETDNKEPYIHAARGAGNVRLNDNGVIYRAIASDALSPVLAKNVLVTVKTPSNKSAVSADGVKLENAPADRDYEITYSEYGLYKITYTAVDAAGKKARLASSVEVVDTTAPEIRFTDGSDESTVQTITLGYKYKIKEYELSDNYSAVEDLTVITFIYNAAGVLVRYNVSEFSLTEEGDYTVYVYVLDEDNNASYASYRLKVVSAQ